MTMKLGASWIWKESDNYNRYNETVIFRKGLSLPALSSARIAITADSYYRLFLNGRWVGDGPCRSWPDHFQYDEFDVSGYLQAGENEVRVIARYFGCGSFHQVPREAGFLAQLEICAADGTEQTIVSDGSWEVAAAPAWISNTPKVSIQMECLEAYDARLEDGLRYEKAAVRYKAAAGPWKGLNPRDVALLTKAPFTFTRFVEANVVSGEWLSYTFPLGRLCHPGLIEANYNTSVACVVTTILRAAQDMVIGLGSDTMTASVNGAAVKDRRAQLKRGDNFLLAVPSYPFTHLKDMSLIFSDCKDVAFVNPLGEAASPWCFTSLPETACVLDDIEFTMTQRDTAANAADARLKAALDRVVATVSSTAGLRGVSGSATRTLRGDEFIRDDAHLRFTNRRVLGDGAAFVESPAALMHDNSEYSVVRPSPQGDIELVYDLGEENIGNLEFELLADAGVEVVFSGVEYINRKGRVQHTGEMYRNTFAYTCKAGVNRFMSLKRRAMRYCYITIRKLRSPLKVRLVRIVESTYPVNAVGSFQSSDPVLNRVWEISARTLKLCMEDTFTDCPLFEQTLWVGDARNESLFAYTAFGAHDLSRRCIELAAQSLDVLPIVGCQVPSAWVCILPAWSFLWGISVWEYYFETADRAFLKKQWPAVLKNLKNADAMRGPHGLLSGPYWNLFDWAPIDEQHRTVLHNSMIFVGAIDAALKCAGALGDTEAPVRLKAQRASLVRAINRTWNAKKRSYPDSIHNDGAVSDRTSIHTSLLAVLHGIASGKTREHAVRNLLHTPEGMTPICSPFAIMYLYEALEKLDRPLDIVESIYRHFTPMLDAGATTVWETFARGTLGNDDFPTRSHCHAWSSAPIYFLNRIVLGIRAAAPGAARVEISPWLVKGLTHAEGATGTVAGAVRVRWTCDGKTLTLDAKAPAGCALRFVRNASHGRLAVVFNGKAVSRPGPGKTARARA
jgi:alpha-L-rhamnosidase